MRFRSVDSLRDFEFHDSVWTLSDRGPESVVFEVKELNLHRDAPQNTENCDMEIENARVSITGFRVFVYEPGAAYTIDASGKLRPAEPQRTYTGDEAGRLFLREAKRGITVCALKQTDSAGWVLSGCGEEPYFEVRLTFDKITIEWDGLRRPAWYVLKARGSRA